MDTSIQIFNLSVTFIKIYIKLFASRIAASTFEYAARTIDSRYGSINNRHVSGYIHEEGKISKQAHFIRFRSRKYFISFKTDILTFLNSSFTLFNNLLNNLLII